MKSERSRREFLQDVSLAGAALVAGASALAASGCAKGEKETEIKPADGKPPVVEETCANGKKKVCAWIDENGCLFIDDADLRTQLNQRMQQLDTMGKPKTGDRYGICVRWEDPGSEEHKMNSLCNC